MSRLYAARMNKGVSQQEVANFLGVTRVAYTRYENGSRNPDPETLSKLAEYFGVTADYILGLDEHPHRITGKKWVPLLGSIPAGQEIVAPLVGAWIEILRTSRPRLVISVAPLVGAWIEIFEAILRYKSIGVAPLVGAWIEIPYSAAIAAVKSTT